MEGKRKNARLALQLAAVLLSSVLYFWLCWRFDNKYTYPRPAAKMGVVRLDGDWYEDSPFFYLADGWAFYGGRLLSPEEIAGAEPDAYLYIGQYGGFDLGDPAAAPPPPAPHPPPKKNPRTPTPPTAATPQKF